MLPQPEKEESEGGGREREREGGREGEREGGRDRLAEMGERDILCKSKAVLYEINTHFFRFSLSLSPSLPPSLPPLPFKLHPFLQQQMCLYCRANLL